MTKRITCVDLPIGAHYKFEPAYRQREDLYSGTYERRETDSIIVSGRLEGTVVPWHGHQNGPVVEVSKPEVHSVTAVPEVSITRKRLTIDKIGVGQTFIIHGQPETVYVKISNSHVFNHKRLQMHTTVAERFKQHLNLVAVELVVYNGK